MRERGYGEEGSRGMKIKGEEGWIEVSERRWVGLWKKRNSE